MDKIDVFLGVLSSFFCSTGIYGIFGIIFTNIDSYGYVLGAPIEYVFILSIMGMVFGLGLMYSIHYRHSEYYKKLKSEKKKKIRTKILSEIYAEYKL